MQPDSIISNPANPQSWNRFSYTQNRPVNLNDPSGHISEWCETDPNSPQCGGYVHDQERLGSALGRTITNPAVVPAPKYYDCSETDNKSCISEPDDPIVQITHTVIGEGGGLSQRAAANILQTILNRAYIYWTQHHAGINPFGIPWERISQAQLEDLILFILSEPYTGGDGVEYPAYNAWGAPQPQNGNFWADVAQTVQDVLASPGTDPSMAPIVVGNTRPADTIRTNVNVQFYGATSDPNWRPLVPYLIVDAVPEGAPVLWQYYGTWPINPP